MRNIFLTAVFLILSCIPVFSATEPDSNVKQVLVIFKTHLDIGFTDLGSSVEQRYINEFIPKAIAVADELKENGNGERYVWTTGAWLIDAYLKQASEDEVRRLEKAIAEGDIVWNGVPYTVESESMCKDMFGELLKLSARIDSRFGRHTTAAKMTDVPGHTRSIIPLLNEAGIHFLHIGVNAAVTVPAVPPVCIWKDPVSKKEIILMYQSGYGNDMILPDGETAVSINFTGDNHGPHTAEQVRQIYSSLHQRYPSASIKAATLNDVERILGKMKDRLPVIESEIGDTWIYGYGSSPLMMKKFREISRLFSEWIEKGLIDPESETAIDFAVRLGMVAEHTWGLDVKSHLRNWDKYDFSAFSAARNLPEFRKMEDSWKEKDENIDKAIAILPENLRKEAESALLKAESVSEYRFGKNCNISGTDPHGEYTVSGKGMECRIGKITYQSFSEADYVNFRKAYLIDSPQWAIEDNGKPGLENSHAQSASVTAEAERCASERKSVRYELAFPEDGKIDSRVFPEHIYTEYRKTGKSIEFKVGIIGKPANRMPEAYWLSILPENLAGVIAEKTGEPVDLLDVVEGGNRQMHGIDSHVDLVTDKGVFRVTSYDAPLLTVGECNALNYSTEQPDLSKGVHFCLYNNLWGTNFSMWWEGSIEYRFKIEIL